MFNGVLAHSVSPFDRSNVSVSINLNGSAMSPKSLFDPTRRSLLKKSAVVSCLPMLGVGLVGCGGGGDGDTPTTATDEVDLLSLTATESVAMIASGQLSAEAYMRALLTRAKQLSTLNAFIVLNEEAALAAAQDVDARRRAGQTLGALAGLPIAVKDNINTSALPTTGGTSALRNVQPSANAPVLQKLLDAGAIVIGKANMHELAFGATSTNLSSFAGPVRNPYNQTLIPGGSSGGTGAAIAAGMSPVGLGSDTGGSVRVPASLCGIAGLRPTVGNGGSDRRYDGTGVLPISHTRDTVGPMGRTVADIALLDAVITGNTVPAAATLSGMRIGVPASFWAHVDSQVEAVLGTAREKLSNAGVVFVDVDMANIWSLDTEVSFTVVFHEAGPDISAYLTETGYPAITLTDIAAGIASPDVQSAFTQVLADPYGANYDNAMTVLRPQMQQIYASYFADNQLDAMMFPTTPVTAPVIDEVNGSSVLSINGGDSVDTFATLIRNTDPGSTAGVPGISIPAGVTSSGLPVGLSLDGAMQSDQRLLAIGMAMEAILGRAPAPNL
jgi:Asp-tRNA(Asn)/Glu-tRNA(Gln) amidotransferase A subunit family amidase